MGARPIPYDFDATTSSHSRAHKPHMLALLLAAVPRGAAGFALLPSPAPHLRRPATARVSELDDHISIDLGYPGIKRLHSSVAAR